MPPKKSSDLPPHLPSQDVRVNLDRLPLSEDLLKYYKERVENNEAELQSCIRALDAIKASHEEQHKMTWELQQRNEEIRALQATVSEAQAAVAEERKQMLKVLAENDELRIQELKDRKKIRYLLALCGQATNEMGEETTYFKPNLEKRLVRQDGGKAGRQRSASTMGTKDTYSVPPSASKASGTASVMETDDRRSKAMPQPALDEKQGTEPGLPASDESEILRLKLQALRAQLDEQERLFQETVDRLKEDLRIRAGEESLRAVNDTNKIKGLSEKVMHLQEFLRENTKEVLLIRKNYLMNERLLKEERVKLVEEVNQLRARYFELRNKSEQVERVVETRIVKKNEGLLHELRTQLAKYEEELRRVRVETEDRESSLKKKVDVLQTKLENLRNNYKALNKRRNYEIEGFTNDILLLRKQVKDLERHIINSAALDDREGIILTLAEENGEKVRKIQSNVVRLKQRIHKVETDMHAVTI